MYTRGSKAFGETAPYEKPIMVKTKGSPAKNYEVYLLQRDVPGGVTQVAMKRDWNYTDREIAMARKHPGYRISKLSKVQTGSSMHASDPKDMPFTFEARRTDVATGNRHIYFKTDRGFMKNGPHKVVVMVTYLDKGTSTWTLEYDNGKDVDAVGGEVKLSDTGKIKTAVFPIGDMTFRGSQQGGMDFRITAAGNQDVIVQLVRVLRMTPPEKTRLVPDRGPDA